MRRVVVVLGAWVGLAARAAFADEPALGATADPGMPTDGAVAFSYSKFADVVGCSQGSEAEMRQLMRDVMRVDPFVAAGEKAPMTLVVWVTLPQPRLVRATFELRDAQGAALGRSYVEDATCDGAHLKLATSIALLLAPREASPATIAPAATAPDTKPAAGSPPAQEHAVKTPAEAPAPRPTPPVAPYPVCKRRIGGYCLPVDIHSFAFALGGTMSLGLTASPGGGIWASAEVRPVEQLSVALGVQGMFPARIVVSEPVDPTKPYGTPKEPDFSSVTGMVVPCFRYWWLMGCAVGQLGFAMAQTPAALIGWPMVGVGPRVGIDIPFADRFFVRAHGDALFNVLGNGLVLYDQNLTWTQSVVSGYIGIGLGVVLK